MLKSEQINELATALSKAQSEIKGAAKTSQNPFFKSSYADLQEVWDACREPLTQNGLSVIQTTIVQEGMVQLETTLLHSSGQWITSFYPLRPTKDDPQGMGSAFSYARRYCLAAIVGVYQKDDDAESATKRGGVLVHTAQVAVTAPDYNTNVENEFDSVLSRVKCDHKWLQSKFNEHEEYCPNCKSKRGKKG
jgi:hypothetical protein